MPSPKDPVKRAKWITNIGMGNKGKIPWNKNLTKETDPRVAAMSAVRVGKKQVRTQKKYPKMSAAQKGENHPMFGKHHSLKTIKKMRTIQKINQNLPEVRAAKSAALKKRYESPAERAKKSDTAKKLWQEPVFIANHIKARHARPNKPEKFLIRLFNKLFPNQVKYTGSGNKEFIIGRCNPDFICLKQKKIIEHFGGYWHQGEDPQEKIDLFAKYGYQTLIIWEHELKDIKILCKKIKKFLRE